jgi:hypothetical protein
MTPDERERLREKVAAENGFQLYRHYSERLAAERLGWDYSTLKRKRRAGIVPFVDRGGGSVAYMGYHLADIILYGVRARQQQGSAVEDASWPNTPGETTRLVTGGSDSEKDRQPTMASATTERSDAPSALALARQSLSAPSRS